MKYLGTIIAFTILFAGVASANQQELSRLCPEGLVSGWTVVKDSTTYGSGDGIVDIYNGGYEVYTNAGVTSALRRLFQRGDVYVEVIAHRMRSAKHASDFLAVQYKRELKRDMPVRTNRFLASGQGITVGYSAVGTYYFTVTTYATGNTARQNVNTFLTELGKKAEPPKATTTGRANP